MKEKYNISERCALYILVYTLHFLQYGTTLNPSAFQAMTGEDLSVDCLNLIENVLKKIRKNVSEMTKFLGYKYLKTIIKTKKLFAFMGRVFAENNKSSFRLFSSHGNARSTRRKRRNGGTGKSREFCR